MVSVLEGGQEAWVRVALRQMSGESERARAQAEVGREVVKVMLQCRCTGKVSAHDVA